MKQVGQILPEIKIRTEHTVNSLSNNKSINTVNSNNTVNSYNEEEVKKLREFLDEQSITAEGIARLIAEGLEDTKSLRYWLLVVRNNNPALLLHALNQTKEAARLGRLERKKVFYFLAILRRMGMKTKFRKDVPKRAV